MRYQLCHRFIKPLVMLCVLIGLLVVTPLFAQEIILQVQDSAGHAISGVSITDGSFFAYSDSLGQAHISYSSKVLRFSHPGYHELKTHISKASRQSFTLQDREILLPVVYVQDSAIFGSLDALGSRQIHPDTDFAVQNAAELFANESSFHSADTRLLGEQQSLSLLGSLSRHTLVMLDGLPLNNAGEAFDFSKISLSQIERIEIVKGSASALGGSSAIGGIVNIISKSPSHKNELKLASESSIGSFEAYKEDLSAFWAYAKWAFRAQYAIYTAKNDFAYSPWWDTAGDYKRDHNAKNAQDYAFGAQYQGAKHAWDYSYRGGHFRKELPGPINFLPLYDNAHSDGGYSQHSLGNKWQKGSFSNETKLFYQYDSNHYKNVDSSNNANPKDYIQSQQNVGFQNRLNWAKTQHKAGILLEYKRLNYWLKHYPIGTNPGMEQNQRLDNLAFGASYALKCELGDFASESQLNLRQDFTEENDYFTQRFTQHFGYEGVLKYSLDASIGTGFAMPSVYDMYWIGDSETIGNPNLKSETSRTYALEAALENPWFKLSCGVQQSEIEDLIKWQQVNLFGPIWKPFNVGSARIRNLETSADLQILPWLKLDSKLSLSEAKDFSRDSAGNPSAIYGKYLTYTPRLKSVSTLIAEQKYAVAKLSYSYTGEQYKTEDNLIDPLKAYDNLDLQLALKHELKSWKLRLSLNLNNLLNKRYEVYSYVPQPGFNWHTAQGISYEL
ncbi:MAG: TonB-dependent receptor [Candidatus Cloacimonetes bacterium]|nr:TonB-dependent receptor [Candidatus Cloacimonadota bacterium]